MKKKTKKLISKINISYFIFFFKTIFLKYIKCQKKISFLRFKIVHYLYYNNYEKKF